jgi:Uma2 family endonuclease
MPDQFHIYQAEVLTHTFRPPEYTTEQMVIAMDLYLYYDANNPLDYKRPDWYAVLGTSHLYEDGEQRLSYVMWKEHIAPFIAVELLSPGTEKEDLGISLRKPGAPPTKWEVYERILGIPYYIVFSRRSDRFRAFKLSGLHYREAKLPGKRIWLPEINLGLGLRYAAYREVERLWLNWYDASGNWIPCPEEQVKKAEQRSEKAEQRAENERLRAENERLERLRAEQQLKQMQEMFKAAGIDPDK